MIQQATSRLFALATSAVLLSNGAVRADIIASSGAVDVLPAPPASVVGGAFENDSDIHVFRERSIVLLANDAQLSISVPGVYNEENPDDTPYTVPAGTRVSSYYVHFDKVGGSNAVVSADGSITFSEAIFGVIIKSGLLNSTHAILGAPQTAYPTGNSQGIEFRNDPNVVMLSADRRTLTFHLAVTCCIDTIRVITGDIADAPGGGDVDSDGDGVFDDQDGCPNDGSKIEPGDCGCGNLESLDCRPAFLDLTSLFGYCGGPGLGFLVTIAAMAGWRAGRQHRRSNDRLRRP